MSAIPTYTCVKCEYGVNGRLTKHSEEQRLIQFLMGLNSSYIAIRGNTFMISPLPNVSQAHPLLVQEEKQRQVKSSNLTHNS